MSLESIKNEIEKVIEAEKSRLQENWDAKKSEQSSILENQYQQAKEHASKLIDKEEHERYIEALLSFKMDEKKRLLEKRKIVRMAILEKVLSSMRELLGENAYYEFILNKVKEFSIGGDTIYLSSRDQIEYAEKLVTDIGHALNIKVQNDLKSGVIIEKPHFNYNFSADALLEENRTNIEAFLGKKLYEEVQESF